MQISKVHLKGHLPPLFFSNPSWKGASMQSQETAMKENVLCAFVSSLWLTALLISKLAPRSHRLHTKEVHTPTCLWIK